RCDARPPRSGYLLQESWPFAHSTCRRWRPNLGPAIDLCMVDADLVVNSRGASRQLRSIEVKLETRLRPPHDTQLTAIGERDVGRTHVWASEADVGWILIRHFHGAHDVTGR